MGQQSQILKNLEFSPQETQDPYLQTFIIPRKGKRRCPPGVQFCISLIKYSYMQDTCKKVIIKMSKIKLGYWRSRGKAQVARLLLSYTGTQWDQVQYKQCQEWYAKDKQSLGFEFPNLPYFIEGDFKLTEVMAISSYIIERSKKSEQLLGKDLKERARILNVVGVIRQIFQWISRLVYDPQAITRKEEIYKEHISERLKHLGVFRGNKEWLFDRITFPDFLLVELSYYIETVFPSEYKNLKFLHEVRSKFLALPEIKSYYDRQTAVKGPFTNVEKATIKF